MAMIQFPWVVASAPGFGAGHTPSVFKAAAKGELTIRLVEQGPPIEGRIVDLEGRPVAGAEVKVKRIYFAGDGDLTAWLAKAKDVGFQNPGHDLYVLPPTITTTKTSPDGRFRLAEIGRERIAELFISGPKIATTQVYAMSRDGAEVRAQEQQGMAKKSVVFHTHRFEHAVEPTKPIEGVVRDKDSGQPIAGLTLHAAVFEEYSFVPAQGIEATTDAQGRYRISGLPKVPAYRLFVEQG